MEEQNNEKKLTDRAFSQLLISLLLGIFVCIVCLCSATLALFSEDVVSSENKIETAKSSLEIALMGQGGEAIDTEGEITLAPGDYTVTLTLEGNSASGYCAICIGEREYLSPYIKRHSEDEPKTAIFTLSLASETTLTLEMRWGIYSSAPSVLDGGTLIIE